MAQNPTILGFMIGIALVGLFVGILGLSLTEWDKNYEVDQTGAINLSKYNKLDDLHVQSKEIKSNVTKITQPSGIFDVLGGFFYNAYQVLKGIPDSINLVQDMGAAALDDTDIEGGSLLYQFGITVLILIIFIGVVLSILLKRDGL